MEATAVIVDLYHRIPGLVRRATHGLEPGDLVHVPQEGANPIGWLIWHLSRGEDAQIADVAGHRQVWTTDDWAEQFGLAADPTNTGFGHSAHEVRTIRPQSADLLVSYYGAVHRQSTAFLATLSSADLDRVVDENWDPPVTLGARLVSIVADELQHVGQAAYLRGLLVSG